MNFIIKLSLNYYNDNVYDAILIIVNRFLKISHYILTKLIESIENLIDVFFDKILLMFFEKNYF